MKIAAPTEDGRTIAPDFARASYYAVLTVDGGVIAGRELRQKRPQGWFRTASHVEHHGPANAAPEAAHVHDQLVDPIRDCEVVLASGIAPVDLGHLEEAEIWPVIVEPGPIDTAVEAFLQGTIVSG